MGNVVSFSLFRNSVTGEGRLSPQFSFSHDEILLSEVEFLPPVKSWL